MLVGDHSGYADDLGALLRGELSRGRHQEVVEHLRACEGCRLDLVDVASSHGGLVAVRRILSGAGAVASERGSDRAGEGASEGAGVGTSEPARLPPLPPLAGHRRGRARTWQILVAAVVAVAVLGGLGAYRLFRQPAPPATATHVQSARLTAVGAAATAGSGGSVTMRPEDVDAATVMTIHATLRPPGPGRFYYAWLLDPATNKMLPLGVVGPGGAATFDVQTALLRRYQAVDVSLESDNGDPGHSATSVLRATY